MRPVPEPVVDDDPFNFDMIEARRPRRRTLFGLSLAQAGLLAVMLVVELVIIGVFTYLVVFAQP